MGKVKVAGDIQIRAALSKKPEFYKGSINDGSIWEVKEEDLNGVDDVTINVDHVEPKHKHTHFISNYGDADASSTHLNHQFLAPLSGYKISKGVLKVYPMLF